MVVGLFGNREKAVLLQCKKTEKYAKCVLWYKKWQLFFHSFESKKIKYENKGILNYAEWHSQSDHYYKTN